MLASQQQQQKNGFSCQEGHASSPSLGPPYPTCLHLWHILCALLEHMWSV